MLCAAAVFVEFEQLEIIICFGWQLSLGDLKSLLPRSLVFVII